MSVRCELEELGIISSEEAAMGQRVPTNALFTMAHLGTGGTVILWVLQGLGVVDLPVVWLLSPLWIPFLFLWLIFLPFSLRSWSGD